MTDSRPEPADRSTRVEWIDRSTLALFFLTLVAFATHKIITYDVWWQIETGRWILEHGFPDTDPFSYGFPDRPWVELRWLYCVAVHLISAVAGLNALIVAKALLLVATFAVLGRLLPSPAGWVVPFGLLSALGLMHVRFHVRPEVLTFLFMALTLLCLERYKRGGSTRWLFVLPALQLVWSNSHTLYVMGPALQWLFVAGESLQPKLAGSWTVLAGDRHPLRGARMRALVLASAASSLACLVTPYPLAGLLFPLTLLTEIGSGSFLSAAIEEFQSPFRFAGFSYPFVSYLALIGLSAASFLLNARRLVVSHLIWWTAFLVLSLMAQRNGALFGLVAAATLMVNLDAWVRALPDRGLRRSVSWGARVASLALVVVLPVAVATDRLWSSYHAGHAFGLGVREGRFPIGAMAFVREQRLPTPVIGGLGDGGYLLYEGGEKSVFLDGRLEVYGSENVEAALRMFQTGIGFFETTAELGVRTAVLRIHRHPELVVRLESAPDWVPVYFDESHLVYVRRSAVASDVVERLRIDWQNPESRRAARPAHLRQKDPFAGLWPRVPDVTVLENQAGLFLRMGNLGEAQRRLEEALALRPDSATVSLNLGLIYGELGRGREAARLLDRLDRKLLERPDVLQARARVAELAGNDSAAFEYRKRAFEAGADRPSAIKALARQAIRAQQASYAEGLLTELGSRFPRDVEVWNLLADLEFIRRRYDAALGYYAKCLELGGDEARIHFNIGTIHARRQRFSDARAAFERALELDPSYGRARESLRQLDSMGR